MPEFLGEQARHKRRMAHAILRIIPGKKKMIRLNAGIAIALFIPVPDQEALHASDSLP